jgi:hypothetical protein
VDDSSGEFIGCRVSAKILCLDLSGFQHVVNGIVDLRAVVCQVNVTQHFRCTEEHGSWISNVLANGFSESVTRSLEKDFF